jgi:hypothetical protein
MQQKAERLGARANVEVLRGEILFANGVRSLQPRLNVLRSLFELKLL